MPTCSRSACSAWPVAAAVMFFQLPHGLLAGRSDDVPPGPGRARYVAHTVAMYVFAGDVIVGALLQRGVVPPAAVGWYLVAAFSLGLLGSAAAFLQNGLYALTADIARASPIGLVGFSGYLLMLRAFSRLQDTPNAVVHQPRRETGQHRRRRSLRSSAPSAAGVGLASLA